MVEAPAPSRQPPPGWSVWPSCAEKVCAQIKLRLAGKPIRDRLVSIADPDARPIRKGKLRAPTEFGWPARR